MNRLRALTVAAATIAGLVMAGCDRADRAPAVTINAAEGDALAAVDGRSGEVKLSLPGFDGQIKLPKLKIDAADFDLNGVRLYPGSTIDNVDVGGAGGGIRIRFSSPAGAERVRDWFQQRLATAGFTLRADGAGLSGTTEEKKPFRLDLARDGASRTHGTVVLGS